MAIFTTDEFVLEKMIRPYLTSNDIEMSEDPVTNYDPGVRLFRVWYRQRLVGSFTYSRNAIDVYLELFVPRKPAGHPDAQVEPDVDTVIELNDRAGLHNCLNNLVLWALKSCNDVSS